MTCNKFYKLFLAILLIGSLACYMKVDVEAGGNEVAAVVTSIKGKLKVIRFEADKWKDAKVGEFLYEGDRIKTSAGSKAAITFISGAEISINEKSTFTIIVNEDKGREMKDAIDVTIGEIFSKIKPGARKFEMRTPNSVAAVRGTEFSGKVKKDGSTTIIVFKGSVEVYNDFGRVLLKKATKTTVKGNKAPMQPVKVDVSKKPKWQEEVDLKRTLQFHIAGDNKVAGVPFKATIKVYHATGKYDSKFQGELDLISDSPSTGFSLDGKTWGVKKLEMKSGKTTVRVKEMNEGAVLLGVSGAGLKAAVKKVNFSLPDKRNLLLKVDDEDGKKTLKLKFER